VKRGRRPYDDVLTPREWQILALIRENLSNEAIAARLAISPQTVKFHVAQILSKLGVSSRGEAALWLGEPKRRAWGLLPLKPLWLAGAVAAVLLAVLGVSVIGDSREAPPHPGITESALDDFAPSPSPAAEARSQHVSEVAELQVRVCIDDHTWQRPSLEEQAAHLEADNRYGRFATLEQSQFAASFWVGAGPATGRPNPLGKLITYTGLWTLGDARETQEALYSGCPREPNVFTHPELVDVWLLGYGAVSARWDGGSTIVVVSERPAGFQAVQLTYPEPVSAYPGDYEFVDAGGQVVGRIETAGFWSSAP
jgi:DNA-binding CsgD family transcriptional regulator